MRLAFVFGSCPIMMQQWITWPLLGLCQGLWRLQKVQPKKRFNSANVSEALNLSGKNFNSLFCAGCEGHCVNIAKFAAKASMWGTDD